jgi:hypothetical protein
MRYVLWYQKQLHSMLGYDSHKVLDAAWTTAR